MRSDELCELLKQKYGITVTAGDLLDRYVGPGLVLGPDPDFHGFTPIHAAMVPAADFCIQKLGWSPERVGLAVGMVARDMASGDDPLSAQLDRLHKSLRADTPEDRRKFWERRINDAFRWGLTVIKAHVGAPLDVPATITEEWKVTDGHYCDALAGDFSVEYRLERGEDGIACALSGRVRVSFPPMP